MKTIQKLLVASLLGLSLPIFAATDGEVGETSEGSVEISVNTQELIRISQLDDVDLGLWDGENDLTGGDTACVWNNFASGMYRLTASGEASSDNLGFLLKDNRGGEVKASVYWDDNNEESAKALTLMKPGQVEFGFVSDAVSRTCENGAENNSILQVKVLSKDMERVKSRNAALTGVVTLTVGAL